LVAADLDINALQQTYINQEQDDQIQQGIYVDPQGNLTAGNQVLKDLLDPVDPQDAATKNYTDIRDALKVSKAGDTMTGPLAMSSQKITGLGDPTNAQDAVTKTWVETATTSPLVQFRSIFYGALATDPAVDPYGNARTEGDLYFNSTLDQMRVFNGTTWQEASADATITRFKFTAAGGETSLSGNDDDSQSLTYNVGLEMVYLNGALLTRGVDYVATTGSSITGLVALSAADLVEVVAFSQIDAIGSIPSANSTFLQSGAGAVQRTVDSKLKDVVSVKDFGAVGDGVADDTDQIRALHAYCNITGQKAVYSGISVFAIQADAQVIVNTDVDFCGARAVILNGINGSPSYSIDRYKTFIVTDPAAPIVSGTVSITTGSAFNAGSYSYPTELIPGAGFLLFYLSTGSGSLPEISDRPATGTLAWRATSKVYADKRAQYPIPVDGSSITTSFRRYRLNSAKPLTLTNLVVTANEFDNQTLFQVERNEVTIDGIKVRHTGTLPTSVNALIAPFECSDFTLRNVQGIAFRNTSSAGTYYFRPTYVANYLVDSCDVRSDEANNWGFMASGWCNGARFNNSHLNRIDIHEYSQNYFVNNCTLYSRGITVGQGGGVLSIKNCEYLSTVSNTGFVQSRSDYGSGSWDGTVEIDNVSITSNTFGGAEGIIIFDWFREPLGATIVQTLPSAIRVSNVHVNRYGTSWSGVTPVAIKVKTSGPGVKAPSSILVSNITSSQDVRIRCELDIYNCLLPAAGSTFITLENIKSRSRSLAFPTLNIPAASGATRQNFSIFLETEGVYNGVFVVPTWGAASRARIRGGSVCRGEFHNTINVHYQDVLFDSPLLLGGETAAPLCSAITSGRFSVATGGVLNGAFNFINFHALSGISSTIASASGSAYPSTVTREDLFTSWQGTT
jgi:hypothetical protein